MAAAQLAFLEAVLPSHAPQGRPRVTLTFAQSIDAKISGEHGKQLILSGKESMIMTHWMRTKHDGILVGIGTALNDDPQLNTRHLPPREGVTYSLPRPIVLDSQLRLSSSCKLLKNFRDGSGRRPWIIGSVDESSSPDWLQRKQTLETAGARVYAVQTEESGKISLESMLSKIHDLGIRSVMVEGGATIIGEFLRSASANLVDTIVITVAPTLVGRGGVSYAAEAVDLQHIRTEIMGKDTVSAFNVNTHS